MLVNYEKFEENLSVLRDRVSRACMEAGRMPEEVSILPVTKTHALRAAEYAARAGFSAVGENRVREALEKLRDPAAPPGLRWELIGHLQSNKARDAATHFFRVQSVDSPKLLNRLNRFAGEAGRRLHILLQVNAGDDPAKFGVGLAGCPKLLEQALGCEHLQVDGLMTIAPLSEDREVARRCFARLRELRDHLRQATGAELRELSMGMTGDLEEAIAEGGTQIRVGTALFGERE